LLKSCAIPASELAQSLHLLALPQDLLALALVGHIPTHSVEVVAFGDRSPGDPDASAVVAKKPVLELLDG
jgi:hypothetical protein